MQKKKICAGYGESDVIDRTCQKRFMKFLGTIDILANYFFAVGCLIHWNMFSSTPGLYPLEPIVGDSRHTWNVLINKVIGENEKCVFYFTEKKNDFLANQILESFFPKMSLEILAMHSNNKLNLLLCKMLHIILNSLTTELSLAHECIVIYS